LQFFVEQTAVQFGTFVPDDLWSSRVLQLAHSNTCIRHALVALSSYHERYWSRDAAGEPLYGLRQYNQAINELVRADRSSHLHIQLVSCTVFICIEVRSRLPAWIDEICTKGPQHRLALARFRTPPAHCPRTKKRREMLMVSPGPEEKPK
jgi:hypothetical protein